MQATAIITQTDLAKLASFLFEEAEPTVFEAYSPFGQPVRKFTRAAELLSDIEEEIRRGQKFLYYSVHFTDTRGHVLQRKIKLDPRKCDGHTWRHTVQGWGLIQLQADLKRPPGVECRIAVNSQKRASAWADTYPELRAPDLWDWRATERHAARIIRRMKKLAEHDASPNGGPAASAGSSEASEGPPSVS
jgi:hypothetical protein